MHDLIDGPEAYINHLVSSTPHRLDGLRVVVDCAHGAASVVGPLALRQAGADVVAVCAEPDGENINRDCGSTHLGGLQRAVVEHGADVGFALDGDADRCLAVLDQGRALASESVDLSALVADAADDARAVDPSREVSASLPDEGVFVAGDEARLRQVLANLMENARVHTPEGTPVEVRVRRSGDEAVVTVADRGPGLTAEEAARVFERFYRGDPSRSRSSGGTGLGLSIAAAVIEGLGGRIEASSTPGEGATFTVTLPLAPQSVAAPAFEP